jgi:hypothetical protein
MPRDEPDWSLITRPPADRQAVKRVVGLLAMTAGLAILAVAVLLPGRSLALDGTAFSLGLILFGGFLRVGASRSDE